MSLILNIGGFFIGALIALLCGLQITDLANQHGEAISTQWILLLIYAHAADFLILQFLKIALINNLVQIINLQKQNILSFIFYSIFPSIIHPSG